MKRQEFEELKNLTIKELEQKRLETTKKLYNKYVMDALKNKEFKLATLGNDAGIYGAAKQILA